ncbi:MAG: Thiol-disulfide isomerase and thioredoxin [Armatimonadetes bacterium]|nr:Thiol-disulfide isomerase and thioredoxin [Armatimonadota bacterium]
MLAMSLPPRAGWAALVTLAALTLTLPGGPARGQGAAEAQVVDGGGVKKAIEASKGKVVLVNYWATWCGPCVAEFPDLVKLQNQLGPKGLVVLGVSFDDPDEKPAVNSFIVKHKVPFPIFVRGSGSIDKFANAFDKRWNGTLPTTLVFDKKGKRVAGPIQKPQTLEQFQALVEPLLK